MPLQLFLNVPFGLAHLALSAAHCTLETAFGFEPPAADKSAGGLFEFAFDFSASAFGDVSGTRFHNYTLILQTAGTMGGSAYFVR